MATKEFTKIGDYWYQTPRDVYKTCCQVDDRLYKRDDDSHIDDYLQLMDFHRETWPLLYNITINATVCKPGEELMVQFLDTARKVTIPENGGYVKAIWFDGWDKVRYLWSAHDWQLIKRRKYFFRTFRNKIEDRFEEMRRKEWVEMVVNTYHTAEQAEDHEIDKKLKKIGWRRIKCKLPKNAADISITKCKPHEKLTIQKFDLAAGTILDDHTDYIKADLQCSSWPFSERYLFTAEEWDLVSKRGWFYANQYVGLYGDE